MIRLLLLFVALATTCFSFCPCQRSIRSPLSSSALAMGTPRFDKTTQRWYPASPEEGSESGYDSLGTLIRQGPKAYLSRVLNPGEYEQACLKFMAQDGCDYQNAQGNIDRMNENPQDWAYERMEADRKGRKIDYVTVKPKAVGLRLVWSSVVFALVGRAIYCGITGDAFNDILR